MSRLYFLTCSDCKVVGDNAVTKNSPAYGMWDSQLHLEFLFRHENHHIEFIDEHKQLGLLYDEPNNDWKVEK